MTHGIKLRNVGDPVPAEDQDSAGGRPRVSVIIPVTERPQPLERVFQEVAPVLAEAGISCEYLFVVEPWGRDLVGPVRELTAAGHPIRIFELGRTMGESAMLQAVLEHARGDVLLTLPSYPRVAPSELPKLVKEVDRGADLALARRTLSGGSRVNRLQNRVFHALLRTAVGGSFQDVASGVRAMRREVLEEVPLYGDFFRFLPVLAEKEGFRVREVAVVPHDEDAPSRVYRPGVYVRRLIDLLGLAFVVRFTRKPLRFFGILGSAAAAVGAVILLALFIQRLGGEGIADRPLLLLGVLFFILGVQAIAIGLVGEIIVHLAASGGRQYRVREDGQPLDRGEGTEIR